MILYLTSAKADNDKFDLDEGIVGRYKFLSFSATNNMFNVSANNNKIYLKENGSDIVATLTNGYYDINELKTELSLQLNSTMSGTVSVIVDSKTNKFTITNTLGFYFTFGTNTASTARKLLGFDASDGLIYTTSISSDKPADLNPCKELFINFVENDQKMIHGQDYFNSSLLINTSSGFGETMRYVNVDNFNQYVDFKNTKRIKVKFHDLNENVINLNSDYSIILEEC